MQLLYAQLPANVTTGLVECIVTACRTTQLDPILISTGDNDSCASSMSLKIKGKDLHAAPLVDHGTIYL